MDRFSENTYTHRDFGPDEPLSTCEGCGQKTTDELVFIPEWNFMGCQGCVASCATVDEELAGVRV